MAIDMNINSIPIIARSLLPNIANLVLGSGTEDYSALEVALDKLKECGFNTFIAEIPYDNKEKLVPGVLSRCRDRGLRVIVQSDSFEPPSDYYLSDWKKKADKVADTQKPLVYMSEYNGRLLSFLEKCKPYSPTFAGVFLGDEPTYEQLEDKFPRNNNICLSDFDNKDGSYYCLRNRYKIMKGELPADAIIFVNLVGAYSKTHVGSHTYEQYLDAFSGICGQDSKPKLWCYDLYPVTESNYLLEMNYALAKNNMEGNNSYSLPILKDNGKIKVDYDNFYNDLRLFHEKASLNGSKFWTYILSMEYMGNLLYHPVNEQFLRFAALSSLAMGCKGVLYWTYHQRDNSSDELYLSAPIDREDRKTASWFFAKRVNSEIAKFNSVFINSRLLEYGHAGMAFPGSKPMTLPMGRLEGIIISGKGALVSRLKSVTQEYIVIVSCDLTRYQDISVSLRGMSNVLEMTLNGYPTQQPSIDDAVSIIKRTIAPGGYLIFRYDVDPNKPII